MDNNEILLTSIDTLINKKIENQPYDKTEICIITDDSFKSEGIYTVKLDEVTFQVYGEKNRYKKEQAVRVNILNNDYSNEKFIVGEYDYNQLQQTYYNLPNNSFYPIFGTGEGYLKNSVYLSKTQINNQALYSIDLTSDSTYQSVGEYNIDYTYSYLYVNQRVISSPIVYYNKNSYIVYFLYNEKWTKDQFDGKNILDPVTGIINLTPNYQSYNLRIDGHNIFDRPTGNNFFTYQPIQIEEISKTLYQLRNIRFPNEQFNKIEIFYNNTTVGEEASVLAINWDIQDKYITFFPYNGTIGGSDLSLDNITRIVYYYNDNNNNAVILNDNNFKAEIDIADEFDTDSNSNERLLYMIDINPAIECNKIEGQYTLYDTIQLSYKVLTTYSNTENLNDFVTNLKNYGFKIKLFYNQNNEQIELDYNSEIMFGNPYEYEVVTQEKLLFKIPKHGFINKIEIYRYNNKKNTTIADDDIKYQQITYLFKDFQIFIGKNIVNLDKQLIIWTDDDKTYLSSQKKEIKAIWCNRNDKSQIINLSDGLSTDFQYTLSTGKFSFENYDENKFLNYKESIESLNLYYNSIISEEKIEDTIEYKLLQLNDIERNEIIVPKSYHCLKLISSLEYLINQFGDDTTYNIDLDNKNVSILNLLDYISIKLSGIRLYDQIIDEETYKDKLGPIASFEQGPNANNFLNKVVGTEELKYSSYDLFFKPYTIICQNYFEYKKTYAEYVKNIQALMEKIILDKGLNEINRIDLYYITYDSFINIRELLNNIYNNLLILFRYVKIFSSALTYWKFLFPIIQQCSNSIKFFINEMDNLLEYDESLIVSNNSYTKSLIYQTVLSLCADNKLINQDGLESSIIDFNDLDNRYSIIWYVKNEGITTNDKIISKDWIRLNGYSLLNKGLPTLKDEERNGYIPINKKFIITPVVFYPDTLKNEIIIKAVLFINHVKYESNELVFTNLDSNLQNLVESEESVNIQSTLTPISLSLSSESEEIENNVSEPEYLPASELTILLSENSYIELGNDTVIGLKEYVTNIANSSSGEYLIAVEDQNNIGW